MLKKFRNSGIKTLAIIVFAVVVFFAVNIIGNNSLKQYDLDLTQDSIYALSKGTKNIIKNIPEPVTLRFFYSRKASNGYPALKSHAERIRAILERYVSSSGGKLNLQVIDPEAFTDDEDLAVNYGIKGIDLGTGENFYLGLAISNSRDDTRSIPFFHPDRQRFVEYEITKAIYDLSQQRRPVIGLLSSIQMGSGPMLGIQALGGGQDWLVLEQLKQGFDIVKIDEKNTAKIPDKLDVLMVVQPKDFSEATLNAIDQYVLGGGKAVFFVDPYKEGVGTGNQEDRKFSPDFNKLLHAWGAEITPDTVIADRKAARPVQAGEDGKGKVDYIAWLNIGKDGLNQEDVTTSILKNVNFGTAGAITDLKTPGMNFTTLIRTSPESMKINANTLGGAPDPNKLLSSFVSENKEYTLAARIEGKAKTAFPEHGTEAGHLAESKGNINVVVVADTDLLRDESWAQVQDIQGYKVIMQNGDNSSFLTNVMELLSGSNDLISLRGRGAATRPFTVVDKLKKDAEEKFLSKEKELKDKLAATEGRLAEIKKQAEAQAGNRLEYQGQQQQEITAFTNQMAQTRKELREVQYELKNGVEHLGSVIKFLNIILMPLLISLFAIFIFMFKGRGRKD